MTAYLIGYEVVCDGPTMFHDCPESAAVYRRFGSMTAVQVRADGRADGWRRRRRDGQLADLCPVCWAEATT